MSRYICFLRAINLGPRNRIAMADLRALLEDLGHRDVVTHLVSGNAVFAAERASEESLVQGIEAAITRRLDLKIRVMIRTPEQLAQVVDDNPLKRAESDPKRFLGTLLDRAPAADRLAAFDPAAYAPNEMVIVDRTVYTWYRDGVGVSGLNTNVIEKRLGVSGTARNWDTLTRVLELARS